MTQHENGSYAMPSLVPGDSFASQAKLLETVIASANDAIIITSADCFHGGPTILYVNDAFTQITGYEPHEVIGKTPRILQGINTDRRVLDELKACLIEGVPFKGELINYSKDNQEYWVGISVVPIKNEHGVITHFTAIERDITERKKADYQLKDTMIKLKRANLKAEAAAKDLEASLKLAQEANQAKTNFLANMSHELRTPMNGILGMGQLLADTALGGEQREFVTTINSSAESLLTLLNDILDFSKIEAGALQLEDIPFSLDELLHDTLSLFKIPAAKHRVELMLEKAPEVPEYIYGDPNRLKQILVNLMGNAVKFTEDGYVKLHIDMEEQQNQSILHVSVQDNGIGIPAEKSQTIFDKFTQADSSVTRRYGGTGLGLAITKQLVAMMRGDIGVSSVVGKGSTFWFCVPYYESNLEEVRRHQTIIPNDFTPLNTRIPASDVRILLVEDTHINQVFAQKLLSKLGITQVDLAANGDEALERYQSNAYDLVFMDCQMPVVDGYEATARIRSYEQTHGVHTPIIAMTANAMMGDREKCLAAGMDEYISKPLKLQSFKQLIQRWVVLKTTDDHAYTAQPAAAEHLLPPVDMEQLSMFTDGDAEEEKMLIALFLEQVEENMKDLTASLTSTDPDQWRKIAHRFKGAAGNFGAMSLHHLCKRAESEFDADAAIKSSLLHRLNKEVARVEDWCHSRTEHAA